jgi:uncharacterized protein YbjT (DUF2867 family)
MARILVTGGTGRLGRDLVPTLRGRGVSPVIVSRRPGNAATRTADLATGVGLAPALEGVDTVVHLAAGNHQEQETANLVSAARSTGVSHLVFISIVGIDEIPFPYYRDKLAAERVVSGSGLGVSVLRTTQFHPFAAALFDAQPRLPLLFTPRLRIQPIDTRVVAEELTALALGDPHGRVADLGGPQILTGHQLAEQFELARGARPRRVVDFRLPGTTWAAYRAGHHLVPANRAAGRTFAEYLAQR